MSESKQKLVYENRVSLGVGQQITLTPAQMGLVLQNQRPAQITQVSVGQGVEYELDSVTQNLTLINPKNQAVTNAHLNVTAQHTIEFKPEDEAAPPAPAPAPASAIRGKEERTFAVVDNAGNANELIGLLPFDTAGESTLPAGVISWGTGPDAGLLTINQSGLYQISAIASLWSDQETVLISSLLRDPTGVAVVEQSTVHPLGEILGDPSIYAGTVALQEIVEVDGAAPLPDRLFALTLTASVPASLVQRGFNNPVGTKVANVIVEKIA